MLEQAMAALLVHHVARIRDDHVPPPDRWLPLGVMDANRDF
jgi:hypothetical protein